MAELAIIGKLPGYNSNIDADHKFVENLKKGITYVDLYPSSYVAAGRLGEVIANSSGTFDALKNFGSAAANLFKSPGLFELDPSSVSAANDPSGQMFTGMLSRMSTDFELSSDFAKKKALRIIAANDSTFTEVFTNSFDATNPIAEGYNKLKGVMQGSPLGMIAKGGKAYSHSQMMQLIGKANVEIGNHGGSTVAGLTELMVGAAFGLNIASPVQWSGSSYNSTLTMFIKLISPTGQPKCIQRNILEPLLYLVAAATPITTYGVVYGYPLLWQVHAHGITNFRLGGIAAMSVTRGSFETTFTKALQPTVIDVRLTIIPLLTDFATQTLNEGIGSIYKQPQYLGVQNPADIKRGTMNNGPVARENTQPEIVSVKL
jgi:hypothetical protein